MPRIVVTPLAELDDALARWRPSHVVSIQSPPASPPRLTDVEHASLTFHDIVDETPKLPDLVHPAVEHAEAIMRVARAWDGLRPLLVHCRFAVSRSPAAAIVAMAAREPAVGGDELLRRVRATAPFATPNARLLAAADRALGRDDLATASTAAGRGAFVATGTTFVVKTA